MGLEAIEQEERHSGQRAWPLGASGSSSEMQSPCFRLCQARGGKRAFCHHPAPSVVCLFSAGVADILPPFSTAVAAPPPPALPGLSPSQRPQSWGWGVGGYFSNQVALSVSICLFHHLSLFLCISNSLCMSVPICLSAVFLCLHLCVSLCLCLYLPDSLGLCISLCNIGVQNTGVPVSALP